MCVWRCKRRRVFVLTDLLNTPVLVNTQHNHWTVTCQIRAYPVHYTHISFSLSLHFRHIFKPSFSHLTPSSSLFLHTSTCSFFFFSIQSYMLFMNPLLPLLAALCLIVMVSNVSVYPCRWGPGSSSRKEGVCRGNWS